MPKFRGLIFIAPNPWERYPLPSLHFLDPKLQPYFWSLIQNFVKICLGMGTDFGDRPCLQYREQCPIGPNFGDPFHFLSWDGQSYHIWVDNSCGRRDGLYVVDCRLYPSVRGQEPAGHCVDHDQLLMVHVLISRYSVMLLLQLLAVRNLCCFTGSLPTYTSGTDSNFILLDNLCVHCICCYWFTQYVQIVYNTGCRLRKTSGMTKHLLPNMWCIKPNII